MLKVVGNMSGATDAMLGDADDDVSETQKAAIERYYSNRKLSGKLATENERLILERQEARLTRVKKAKSAFRSEVSLGVIIYFAGFSLLYMAMCTKKTSDSIVEVPCNTLAVESRLAALKLPSEELMMKGDVWSVNFSAIHSGMPANFTSADVQTPAVCQENQVTEEARSFHDAFYRYGS